MQTSKKLTTVVASLALVLVQTAPTARSEPVAQCAPNSAGDAAVVDGVGTESVAAGGQLNVEIVGPTARDAASLPEDAAAPQTETPHDLIIPVGTGVDAETYAARKAMAANPNTVGAPCAPSPLPQAPASPAASSESGEPGAP